MAAICLGLNALKIYISQMGQMYEVVSHEAYTVKSLVQDAPILKTKMFLVSSCSCLSAIYWSQVIGGEWRCS